MRQMATKLRRLRNGCKTNVDNDAADVRLLAGTRVLAWGGHTVGNVDTYADDACFHTRGLAWACWAGPERPGLGWGGGPATWRRGTIHG